MQYEDRLSWQARGLRYYAYFVVLATVALIFLGGQVKSHEAGLAVPDWPLTYNQNPITYPISEWRGGIFHEHFHRLWAGGVGLLTIGLAVWLAFGERRTWLKLMGGIAVATVCLQGLLGGLTVIYKLPVAISSAHGILAQTFLLVLFFIAYGLSRERRSREAAVRSTGPERALGLVVPGITLVALVYGQLFLGAVMRHTESGLAVPDFPTMAGQWVPSVGEDARYWVNDWRLQHTLETGTDLPPVSSTQMLLHLAHRFGAVVVTGGVVWLLVAAWRRRTASPRAWHAALLIGGVTTIQVTLGILTVMTAKTPLITSFHVVTGAALLTCAFLFCLRAWPIQAVAAQPAAPSESAVAPGAEAATS